MAEADSQSSRRRMSLFLDMQLGRRRGQLVMELRCDSAAERVVGACGVARETNQLPPRPHLDPDHCCLLACVGTSS